MFKVAVKCRNSHSESQWFSLPVGSLSRFCPLHFEIWKIVPVLGMYRPFLSMFPKWYSTVSVLNYKWYRTVAIYIALFQVLCVIEGWLKIHKRMCIAYVQMLYCVNVGFQTTGLVPWSWMPSFLGTEREWVYDQYFYNFKSLLLSSKFPKC